MALYQLFIESINNDFDDNQFDFEKIKNYTSQKLCKKQCGYEKFICCDDKSNA